MDKIEEIKMLKSLLDRGAITNEEFNSLKNNIINQQLLESEIVSGLKTNHSKTFTRSNIKTVTISTIGLLFVILTGVIVLNHAKLIPTPSLLQPKQDEFGKEYVYEDGKNLGVMVKLEIESGFLNHGTNGAQHEIGNLVPLNIPDGKMWTPLYYETTQGNKYPKISFLPKYKGENYLSAAEYRFNVKKEEFVSCKVSKRNFKPLIKKDESTISVFCTNQSKNIVYFLEESY
jgi:hypothetical protein